jgi:hypothetical protein
MDLPWVWEVAVGVVLGFLPIFVEYMVINQALKD